MDFLFVMAEAMFGLNTTLITKLSERMLMQVRHFSHLVKGGILARLPTEVGNVLRNLVRSILIESVKSRIRKLERCCRTLGDYFDLIQDFEGPVLQIDLSSGQKKTEILNLLGKASKLGLQSVAEVGTCRGGTFYLLCKASDDKALILTIDIEMPRWRKRLLKSYLRVGQTSMIIRGDSHQRNTVDLVKRSLQSQIDLLFIDGDHSYTGVRKDFTSYSPLVRKGGWIAFHDILPVGRTHKGIRTGGWTGEVPKFWNEVRRKYRHFEIVDNPTQDGCGIGVIVRD